uniref:Uncharacterized protein n=1 Tax=Nelumbo nucifera TaxID=4432 RepID=A0A822XNT0_NELNU|nr:TPA_asm: hypothetical protein HUJ06_022324 [Nelumbo nucifera]
MVNGQKKKKVLQITTLTQNMLLSFDERSVVIYFRRKQGQPMVQFTTFVTNTDVHGSIKVQ